MTPADLKGIAIIGMAGRFPGAADIDAFWRNLAEGVESISRFTDEELAASGYDVEALKHEPNFVPCRGIVPGVENFDASFFNMAANEAAVTDPQQRVFLETAWQALENAGYDVERIEGLVGVYGGLGGMSYYLNHLHARSEVTDLVGERMLSLGNDKDFLATRVAYKLNLKGPALNINTACSTSLVTVCQACQELLTYQCDLALAGGVSLTFPQKAGVRYQEGGVFSPDGHCRPFDVKAQGAVSSDGVGIVILKRLSEAVADGDQIYAVIKGFGRNNDGSAKVGFSAPSVDGQAEAIATAQAAADIEPDSISYVEAHGTATPLGDPIEIAALTQAFRLGTDAQHFCALGSVKGNIGHLNSASGVASLIKTALAFTHEKIPATLNFTAPNPKIDFEDSPFFVNTTLRDWKRTATPRRAGVSAFGLGGTNAHVVLEEAPATEPSGASRPAQLLVFSARSAAAVDDATKNFVAHLKANPEMNLADAAYTLKIGRRVFPRRRIVACRDAADAIAVLEAGDPARVVTQKAEAKELPVVFMFPGTGAEYAGMGAELYRSEPFFKEELDRCSDLLLSALGLDLRQVLYPAPEKAAEAAARLAETRVAQPALFAVEYALAKLWMSWGVKPATMIGQGVGEYVAACLAGVFTLEEAVRVVAGCARLIQELPAGTALDSLSEPLTRLFEKVNLKAPSIPFISGMTGRTITPSDANRPAYWASLLIQQSKVTEGLGELLKNPDRILLEVGPGRSLSALANEHPSRSANRPVLSSFFASRDNELVAMLTALGSFWAVGKPMDWPGFYTNERRRRVSLPTYPFQRERYWIEPTQKQRTGSLPSVAKDARRGGASTARNGSPAVRKPQAVRHSRPDIGTVFVAPSTPSELAIAAVWQELIGLVSVGIDDDFYALGGDSLLAMRVINRLNKSLGFNPSIPVFAQNPTVGKLAAILDEDSREPDPSEPAQEKKSTPELLTFRDKGSRPPLFFLHGDWSGGGLYCGRIFPLLSEEQPFYVLTPYRTETPAVVTIEEMAAHHLAILREHTPHGPYMLGGYCIGALVAIEMARRLVEEGEEVVQLLPFDVPQDRDPALRQGWLWVDKLGNQLKWELPKKIRIWDRYVGSLVRWTRLSPRARIGAFKRRFGLVQADRSEGATPELSKDLGFGVYYLAYCLYDPKPVSVPATLIFSEESHTRAYRVKRAREIFQSPVVEILPGGHYSSITTHINITANRFEQVLARISPPAPGNATLPQVPAPTSSVPGELTKAL